MNQLVDWWTLLGGTIVENGLALGALLVAGFSWWASHRAAAAAARSADVAQEHLDVLTRPIEMVDNPSKMAEILPAWYVQRMANDWWSFGLIMDTGLVVAIRRILKMSSDGRWLEVELMERDDAIQTFPESPVADMQIMYGLRGRNVANVQVAKIIGALDLANT